MRIMFYVVPILMVLMIVFTILLMFSASFRGKIMSKNIKAMKKMVEYSEDDLKELANKGVNIKKDIIYDNENSLRDITRKEADINSEKVEVTARAIKKGLTEDNKMYCKYCGTSIDNDSKFCKHCGKEQ